MQAHDDQTEVLKQLLPVKSGEAKEPLQVRIPPRIKRAFKAHAALMGVEPNVLFVTMWEHYRKTTPATGAEESGK